MALAAVYIVYSSSILKAKMTIKWSGKLILINMSDIT